MATTEEMKKRFQAAKAFNPEGKAGGSPARQQTAQTSFSPDYQKSKYAQRDAGLVRDRAPQFSAPGFKGKAKKARIHSQRVQYERERRLAADKTGLEGMRQAGQTQRTGMQQRGQTQRQQAGFVDALQRQQADFGQQSRMQQNRFGQQDKTAGVRRRQDLQDMIIKGGNRGLSESDRVKYGAQRDKGYSEYLQYNPELDRKGKENPSYLNIDQYGAQHMPTIQSALSGGGQGQGDMGFAQQLLNGNQQAQEERPRDQGPGYRQLADGSYTNRGMDNLSNSVGESLTAQGVDLNKPLEPGGGSNALFLNQQAPQMRTTQAEIDNADVAYRSQPLTELLTNPQQYGPQPPPPSFMNDPNAWAAQPLTSGEFWGGAGNAYKKGVSLASKYNPVRLAQQYNPLSSGLRYLKGQARQTSDLQNRYRK